MLIKFKPEDINYEEQPVVQFGEDIKQISIPSFEVKFLAQDDDNMVYAKVYGDVALFQSLNTLNVTYFEITELPVIGLHYYVDSKYGQPKDINELLKLQMRTAITNEVGDVEDLISDLSKRITMLERLTIRLTNDLMTNHVEVIPIVNAMYKPLVDSYLYLQEQNQDLTSISDLEDPLELFLKLFNRSIKTTQIVKEQYMDKKI